MLFAPARIVRDHLGVDEADDRVLEHLEVVVHPGNDVGLHDAKVSASNSTVLIQLRWRRVRRSASPSPSNEAGVRRRRVASTLSNAFTLTTAYRRPAMRLVTTGTMPQSAQRWNRAVFVPNS